MIPNSHRDLLERPVVVSLATAMRDGVMQVQPVWCSYDGEHVEGTGNDQVDHAR